MRISKKTRRDILLKALFVGIFLGVLFGVAWNVAEAKGELIDPTKGSKEDIIRNILANKDKPFVKPTLSEFKAYVKQIFGSKWTIAFAVAQSECNSSRREWPVCVNSWAKERSIGPFQINIAQDNGNGTKVHWDKIPGSNLKEKELYLADWRNNVLVAYRVSDGGRNWNPWTAYASGAYKSKL
jgi:hypothetical protein